MRISIPIYQMKEGSMLTWIPFSLGPETKATHGKSPIKMEQEFVRDLTKVIERSSSAQLDRFQLIRGLHLKRVRLDLALRSQGKKRRRTGLFPLILEPRWLTAEDRITIAYHPFNRSQWFPVRDTMTLEEQACAVFQEYWSLLSDADIEQRKSNEKDGLRIVSFSAQHHTILDQLPKRGKGVWDDLEVQNNDRKKDKKQNIRVISSLGTNHTALALNEGLFLGLPRQELRAQLASALRPGVNTPVVLIGPPGVGKTTLLNRWVHDLAEEQGYHSHQNPDKLHKVWAISGRALIAGMSYVGEWEERCMDLIQEARTNPVILLIEDLHMWGRIGRSRDSSRCLADVFRGPIARGEIAVVARCTSEEFALLESDAESFAAAWRPIPISEPNASETLRFLIYEVRRLERETARAFDPFALRTVLELSDALYPSQAFPGKALELLRSVVHHGGQQRIDSLEVIRSLSKRTGLPAYLMEPGNTLTQEDTKRMFSTRVMGQEHAVEVVSDVVLKMKAGMLNPRRPCGVLLFAGPTGTGKTELAKTLAHVLYSSPQRLVRLDMSEYSGPDAPGRLLGDAWSPKGVLTQHIYDQPFSVVLLDEIEKAHPRVLGLLLQLFDEGRLTDAQGQVADFRNAVLIMTSNLGAKNTPLVGFDGAKRAESAFAADTERAVRAFFAPELFNRIDRIVPFRPISPESARLIANKELNRLSHRRGLTERDILVTWTPRVVDLVVQNAFDVRDGARSVKRYLDDRIGTLLVEDIATSGEQVMRYVQIFAIDSTFKIHSESFEEAPLWDEEMALEGAEERSVRGLIQLVPKALAFVARVLGSAQMQEVNTKIRALTERFNVRGETRFEGLFALEALRQSLRDYQEYFEEMLYSLDPRSVFEAEHEEALARSLHGPEASAQRTMDLSSVSFTGSVTSRDALLDTIADVYFVQRALALVDDPDQHEVYVRLTPLHTPHIQNPDLLSWLCDAYQHQTRSAVLEGWMWTQYGDIEHWKPHYGWVQISTAQCVVLRLVGTCVRELFATEEGCHVLHGVGETPKIVRVDLFAGADHSGEELIRDVETGRTQFQEALERGDTHSVENPVGLTPMVRKLGIAEYLKTGWAGYTVDVEDFRIGVVSSGQIRIKENPLRSVLPRLWRLAMSRGVHAEDLDAFETEATQPQNEGEQ